MANYTITVEASPSYDEAKNPRTHGGAFMIAERMPRDLWDVLKRNNWCIYLSADDLEDQDMFDVPPGWRYSVEALRYMVAKAGCTLTVYDQQITNAKALSDLWSPAGIAARKALADAAEHEREKKQMVKNRIGSIADYIREVGEKPEGNHTVAGEDLFDSGNIYGGGSWFAITDTHIWFIRNNGADGDNWSYNNVMTGGAGAIGWRIPYNQAITDELRSLERGELSEFVLPALEPRRQSTLDAFFGDN